MTNSGIEDMIGMHVRDIPYAAVNYSSENESDKKIYWVSGFENEFLSKSYDFMAITTDKNDTIESINIYLGGVMDRTFYNRLVEKYDSPQSMTKRDQVISSKITIIDSVTTARSTKGTLKECKFKDNPLFIRWDRPKFQMEFVLQREFNRTELRISKIPEAITTN